MYVQSYDVLGIASPPNLPFGKMGILQSVNARQIVILLDSPHVLPVVICLRVVSLSCLNMANAAAEHTQLLLEVNRIVHTLLQQQQFQAAPSSAARASFTGLVPRRTGLWWDLLLPTITLTAVKWFADRFCPRYASQKIWVS